MNIMTAIVFCSNRASDPGDTRRSAVALLTALLLPVLPQKVSNVQRYHSLT